MKYFVILLFLFTGFSAFAHECSQPEAKSENPAEYLSTVAESLSHIKIKFLKMSSLESKSKVDPIDVIVAIKEIQSGYFCSAAMLSSYTKSKDENIAMSAKVMSMTYQFLGSGIDDTITNIKAELDGQLIGSVGSRAEKTADKMLDVKNKWKTIIDGINVATYSAVDLSKETSNKSTDVLLITKVERDRIVDILQMVFKLPTKKGDLDPIDVAASVYYHFLNQPWKFKNSPGEKNRKPS